MDRTQRSQAEEKAEPQSFWKGIADNVWDAGARAVANIRQEYERVMWGHPTSYTYGERSPAPQGQGDPMGRTSPAGAKGAGEAPQMEPGLTGSEERAATADAWRFMEAAGTENALAETRSAVGHHPYSFHDVGDVESRSGAREAMEARTAGLQAQERADNIHAANLGVREPSAADLYGGPQPQAPDMSDDHGIDR